MYFLELQMTATGFGLVHTFHVSVYVVRIPPNDFLSLTNKVHHQFWKAFSTSLQSPNFYHSSISIFDRRQRSHGVYRLCYQNNMTIETSISSQAGKNSRPYFQCVHQRLVPGKRHQRYWHSSKLNSRYWKLVYIPGIGMVSGFFWIFLSFDPGTHFYRKQTKYTTPAANPVRTTTIKSQKSRLPNFQGALHFSLGSPPPNCRESTIKVLSRASSTIRSSEAFS